MILHTENCEHKEDDNNDHDHSHGHDHGDNPDHRHDVRVRWQGHLFPAEVNITVDSSLSVEKGYGIVKEFRHELLHHLRYLSDATIHVDPVTEPGS